jgi:hypothetical protein
MQIDDWRSGGTLPLQPGDQRHVDALPVLRASRYIHVHGSVVRLRVRNLDGISEIEIQVLINLDISRLKNSKGGEHVVRFLFGGLVTVIVGFIAKEFGPAVAGLFLAFPAIFPATATLIQSREEERKRQAGMHGERRGIDVAGADAMGAALGSCALAVFAMTCWKMLPSRPPAMVLGVATLLWLGTSVAAWFLWKRFRRRR